MAGSPPDLHASLAELSGFLGVFEGEGRGDYPTIDAFTYREQVTFSHVGKPFLAYAQRTWHPEHGTPMHAETGYLRAPSPGRVEFVLTHPTGLVEVEEGTLDDGVLQLRSTTIGRTATAKPVHAVRRTFVLSEDTLRYDLWMAHDTVPETHHLHAELHRVA